MPVSYLGEHSGPPAALSICKFLSPNLLDSVFELTCEEEFERGLKNRSGVFTCYLGSDWPFPEIEKAVTTLWLDRPFAAGNDGGIAPILIRFVFMIDDVVHKILPGLSATAIADFWTSWQLQNYVARFCDRLDRSETAAEIARIHPLGVPVETKHAQHLLYRWLSQFAYELRESESEYRFLEGMHLKCPAASPQPYGIDKHNGQSPVIPTLSSHEVDQHIHGGVASQTNGVASVADVKNEIDRDRAIKREQVYPRRPSWDPELYGIVADYLLQASDRGINLTVKGVLETARVDRADYSKLLNGRKPKTGKSGKVSETVPQASRMFASSKSRT